MANYASLKAAIQQVVKTNGNNEITGALLQQSLLAMIDSIGAGFQFMGVATPSTTPGTPDYNVAYIGGPGTYANFGNHIVPDGYLGVFKYNGSWTFETVQVGKNYEDAIGELKNALHIDFAQYNGWMNNDSGNYVSTTLNTFIVIPIIDGVQYKITCNGTPCHCAFLNSFNGIPSTTFDINGNRIILSPVGAEATGTVPTGAKFLYVLRKYQNSQIALPTITIGGVTITNTLEYQILDLLQLLFGVSSNIATMQTNIGAINDLLDLEQPYLENVTADTVGYINITGTPRYISNSDYNLAGPRYLHKGDTITIYSPLLGESVAVVAKSSTNNLGTATFTPLVVGTSASGYQTFTYTIQENGYYVFSWSAIHSSAYARVQHIAYSVIDEISGEIEAANTSIEELNDALQNVPAYTERIVPTNDYYLNNIYESLLATGTSPYVRITAPVLLNPGDHIKVVSPGMSWDSGFTVVGLASGPDLLTARFQSIQITPTGSGYGQTFEYTVESKGYYVISYATTYLSAYAEISHVATNAIDSLQQQIDETQENVNTLMGRVGVAVNVFGDVMPENFKSKFFGGLEDTEIVCVGDSLTGLINYSGELSEPSHRPPGMTYDHWTYKLFQRVCLNKPVCDRLDSQRNGADVFTKVGTWVVAEFDSAQSSGDYGEYSVAANTYKSASTNASVSFAFDATNYEKLTAVFSMEPDGAETQIVISQGNGQLLASLDKVNFVEANGFAVSQLTTNMRERHRRIWLKRVAGVTGTINVTVQRTDTNTSRSMYFWGTEKWNGATVFVTNLGRGGRNINLLNKNRSDVFDRKPDLCILELPLANETVVGSWTLEALKPEYLSYMNNFATGSNNFTEIEMLVVLPTGRSGYFDGNQAVIMASSGTVDMINHFKARAIFDYVTGLLVQYGKHAGLANLMDQVYNEGLNQGYTLQSWLAASSLTVPTITRDGVHLNKLGSAFWAKYLTAIFQ